MRLFRAEGTRTNVFYTSVREASAKRPGARVFSYVTTTKDRRYGKRTEDGGIRYDNKNLVRRNVSLPRLFAEYTKRTRYLMVPHREFIHYLGGGMAVKLYLQGRGIKPVFTQDFDFKFAVPTTIKSQEKIEELSEKMKRVMTRHMKGFVRFLNKVENIRAVLHVTPIEGVPLNKPGPSSTSKKVYKAFTFSISGLPGKEEPVQLVDTSLVTVPGIQRTHLSRKWSVKFGMPVMNLTHMWRETMYIFAGSFVLKTAQYRNPINGNKKEKGLKNAVRAGHLTYLSKRYKSTKQLVKFSRQLVGDVIVRDKKKSIEDSKKVMNQLKILQRLNSLAHQRRR